MDYFYHSIAILCATTLMSRHKIAAAVPNKPKIRSQLSVECGKKSLLIIVVAVMVTIMTTEKLSEK